MPDRTTTNYHLTQLHHFLTQHLAQHGYAPSIREIQAGLGVSSTSVVGYRLGLLERRGLIRRRPGCARTIQVVAPAEGGAS